MGELQDGLSSGKLLHQLADKRCKNFNTCADEANTMSNVNKQLLQLFNVGQGQLQAGLCDDARETTAKVVDLMYVPMIQGTQRYAYKVEKAFESVYSALGIKCSDVGGLMDDGTGDYYKGAEPCSDGVSGGGVAGIIIGSVAGGVALVSVG